MDVLVVQQVASLLSHKWQQQEQHVAKTSHIIWRPQLAHCLLLCGTRTREQLGQVAIAENVEYMCTTIYTICALLDYIVRVWKTLLYLSLAIPCFSLYVCVCRAVVHSDSTSHDQPTMVNVVDWHLFALHLSLLSMLREACVHVSSMYNIYVCTLHRQLMLYSYRTIRNALCIVLFMHNVSAILLLGPTCPIARYSVRLCTWYIAYLTLHTTCTRVGLPGRTIVCVCVCVCVCSKGFWSNNETRFADSVHRPG